MLPGSQTMKSQHNLGRINVENEAAVSGRRRSQKPDRFAAAIACMLAMLLAGCGDTNRRRIIGTWELESAARIASRLKETDADSSNNNDSRMSVEFQSNGVLKSQTMMGSMNRQKEGTWKLLSFDEASSTMRLKCVLGLQESQLDIEFLDVDTIQMVPPNLAGLEMKLRFKRAAKK